MCSLLTTSQEGGSSHDRREAARVHHLARRRGRCVADRRAGQKSGKIARVGMLTTANPRSTPFVQAFEGRLRDLGYVEGQNITIEFRNAEGEVDRLPDLAADLVRGDVDVIVTATDPATGAAKSATTTI